MTAKQQPRDRDGETGPPRGRRYPRLSLALAASAFLMTVLILVTDIDGIPLDGAGGRLGVILLFVAPVLLLAGSLAAAVDRSIGAADRVIWAVILGLMAVFYVPGLWFMVVLVAGP